MIALRGARVVTLGFFLKYIRDAKLQQVGPNFSIARFVVIGYRVKFDEITNAFPNPLDSLYFPLR